jgi:hypothetical protein
LLWMDVDPRLVTLHVEPDFLALRRHLRFD